MPPDGSGPKKPAPLDSSRVVHRPGEKMWKNEVVSLGLPGGSFPYRAICIYIYIYVFMYIKYIYIYIYIYNLCVYIYKDIDRYIYIYRERERDIDIYLCVLHMFLHLFTVYSISLNVLGRIWF